MKAQFAYYTETDGKISFLRGGRKSDDIGYFVRLRLDRVTGSLVIPVPETIEGKPVTLVGIMPELPDNRPVPEFPEPLIRELYIPSRVRHLRIGASIVRNGAMPDPDCGEIIGLFNGTEIKISPDNKKYRVFGQGIYSADMTKLYHIFSPGETFSVPDEVQLIIGSAGCALKRMKRLIVPEGTEVIDKGAFEGCTDLEEADIKAKNIGNRAFYGCKSLTSISLGELDNCCRDSFAGGCGLDKILEKAYACCYELKKFQCRIDKNTGDYELSLGCTAIVQPDSPDSDDQNKSEPDRPSVLGNSPFRGNEHLRKLVISNIESVGYAAFAECHALNSVFIENAARIGMFAFMSCGALRSANLDCKEIYDNAFNSCISLETVTLSNTKVIRGGAFSQCRALKEIDLPDTLRKLGEYAFYKTSIQRLTIPPGVKELGTEVISSGVLEIVSVNNTLAPPCEDILHAGVPGVTLAVRSAETGGVLYELDLSYIPTDVFSGLGIGAENPIGFHNRFWGYNDALFSARNSLRSFPNTDGSAFDPLKRYVSELTVLNVLDLINRKDSEELWEYPYFDDIGNKRLLELTDYSAKHGAAEITVLLMRKLHERGNENAPDLEL